MARRKYKAPEVSQYTLDDLEVGGFLVSGGCLTESRDNRRDKSYGCRVSLAGWVEVQAAAGGKRPFLDLPRHICQVFGALAVKVEVGSWHWEGDRTTFQVEMPWLMAEKPSLILTEEEAWGRHLITPELALKKVGEAVLASHAGHLKQVELADRALQAGAIRDWASQRVVDAAQEACRFTQRLAALRAEMLSEVEKQFESLEAGLRDELPDHTWGPQKVPFSSRAIEVGIACGREKAMAQGRELGGNLIFRMSTPEITADEVK